MSINVKRQSANEELEQRASERTAELISDSNFTSAVLETVPALIVVLAADGRVVRCNTAAELICGWGREDLVGRSIWDLGLVPAEETEDLRNVLARLNDGADSLHLENHWLSTSGEKRLIAWTITAMRTLGGGLDYIIKSGIDITEQRRAESEARAHETALLHSHRTMVAGELAGALAHEINQPLTAITTLCEATLQELRSVRTPKVILQNLHVMTKQAQRAGYVIHELRAFISRREVQKETVDVNTLARTANDLVRSQASNHKIRVELDLAPEAIVAFVAPIHVEHALINLLRNGIEAIRQSGRSNGRIALKTYRSGAGMIEISIADNGCGFGVHDPDAFEAFYTSKPDGLGLGLTISRRVVEANGGRLWVESTCPDGSSLRISLPASA